jgi:hypothetical protein
MQGRRCRAIITASSLNDTLWGGLGNDISAAIMGLPREECDAEIPLSKVVCGQAAVAAIV